MSEHTKGLLVKDYRGTVGHIKAIQDEAEAKTPTLFRYDLCALSIGESRDANAERLVACWNALASVPDPSAVGELMAFLEEVASGDYKSFPLDGCLVHDAVSLLSRLQPHPTNTGN